MTSSNNKEELPPHWIVKTSRQYPSLSYYANVKTGQSSWKHPSLMKESELKSFSKIKDKKKTKKNVRGKKATDEEEQEKSPSKGNFIPIGSDRSSAAVGSTQVLKDDAGDGKGLKTKEESNINSKNDKSKKVKFTISKRNVLSTFPNTISSPKKSVALHPSILLAQKIATRDSHLNVKRKVEDKKDKQSSHAEVQSAKKIKSNKESLKSSVAVNQTAGIDIPTTSENHLKTKESNEAEEANRSIPRDRKKEFKRKKKQKHKRHKEESSFRQVEKDRSSIKKHEEDTGKTESEVDQVYHDFVARKSKLWQINRYSSHQGQSAGTLHLELLRDGDHNEIPSTKVRPEEKHEEEEKEEEASVSSKEVPYADSPKESRPTLQSEDSAYPKVTEMEIDEAELNMEIANFRVSASYSRLAVSEDVSNSNTCLNSKSLYFVVDTNVLIGDIDLLEELKSTSVNSQESVVLVPYVVLQEMDGLKKSPAIGQACQVAVRWCNQHFEKQHRRVQGQTYSNYRITVEENKRASADDLVRDCCLLLAREGLDVCLLTNDVNLRNKALMSNLSAFSAKDLRSKLRNISAEHIYGSPEPSLVLSKCEESNMKDVSLSEVNSVVSEAPPSIVGPRQHTSQLKHRPDQKVRRPSYSVTSEDTLLLERITTSLHHTLSNILQDVMKEIYEDLWVTIIMHKPPWNLKDLFACWEKHWIAAMTDRFPSRVKELLAEINKLLTISQVDVQKLLTMVQQLYSYFKSKPYSKHVHPVQDSSLIVDMSEAPLSQHACSTPPCADGVEDSCQPSTMSGVINVEKMINQVGAHITHFVALVLTTFGIQHNLQTLSSISECKVLTPDNARTSGINLHKVIISLGTAIARCLNERTSSALQDLGHMLSNFWSEAHLPCPHLPFTECDLRQFVESPNSAQYLGCVLQELESLVQQLTPILATV